MTKIIEELRSVLVNQKCNHTAESVERNTRRLENLFRSWALETFRDYWFHAGEWHNAGCDFIRYDHGVCNCNHAEIRRKIEEASIGEAS